MKTPRRPEQLSKSKARQHLREILALDLAALPEAEALRSLGLLIDYAAIVADAAALDRAIEIHDLIRPSFTDPGNIAKLSYFLGNAWDELRHLRRAADGKAWAWKQPELEAANRAYRSAYACEGFAALPAYRQCQILTNIGNHFDHVGRTIEAVQYWDQALLIEPRFGMAVGNRGMGLFNYARQLYDSGHRVLFVQAAYNGLLAALELPLEGDAGECFRGVVRKIELLTNGDPRKRVMSVRESSLGRSKQEREFRSSCLRQRLFLNPLNDVGRHSAAARDVLTTPSMTTGLNEGPRFQGFFNQLKQEYVSARYLYIEGARDGRPAHYSDREVLLLDTLDYPVYGLAAEQLRLAFRMSFSILDKVAFFLNEYLRLGVRERDVTYRRIWYVGQDVKRGEPREDLVARKNLALRGLYWLSRDLMDLEEDAREAIEPEARDLTLIRNHLEHKYLKLHSEGFRGEDARQPEGPLVDSLAFSLNRTSFERKCLKMLRLARAAIMGLSFAIHREEDERAKTRKPGTVIAPIFLMRWPDEWKR